MNMKDIENRLKNVFDEVTEFFIPKKCQAQFQHIAYMAGSCIHALANDKEPSVYGFYLSDSSFAATLIDEFKITAGICNIANGAINFCDGKYTLIIGNVGSPEDIVEQARYMHNMFYYRHGKVVGLVPECYLKSNNIVINNKRTRNIARILLGIPSLISSGMTISDAELASIILKLCDNFSDDERCFLNNCINGNNSRNQNDYPDMPMPFGMSVSMSDILYAQRALQAPQLVPPMPTAKGGFNLPF